MDFLMKKLFSLALLATPLFTHAFEHGKIFYSFDSENEARVVIVPAKQKQHFYINYKNFNHKYDNQTLLYKKVKNDLNNGFNYQLTDTSRINIRNNGNKTLIHGTLYSYSTVYLSNDSQTKIIYAGDADIVQARNIKKMYHDRQLDVSSKIEAKKRIKSATETFKKSCNNNTEIIINWNAFVAQKLKVVPAKLSIYLDALSQICAIDSDYLDAVNSITKIHVSPAEQLTKHLVSLENNQLTINIAKDQANLPETSYQAIFDTL